MVNLSPRRGDRGRSAKVMNPTLVKLVSLAAVGIGLAGCSSKVIEHPGMKGKVVWEDSGMPIAGVDVQYSHKGRILTAITDADGMFLFLPVFSRDYAGFPVTPVGLQPELTLPLLWDRPLSFSGHFVKHTDVSKAVVDMGAIKIARVFRPPQP